MKSIVGMTIETGEDQGLSFLLARNESLRLDENSTIRVDAGDQFTLLSGRVYADTGEFVYRDGGLQNRHRDLGAVTDIGTQFAVSVAESNARCCCAGRTCRYCGSDSHMYVAMSGERVTLDEQGEVSTVDALALTDDYWNWTTNLAPDLRYRGQVTDGFLEVGCSRVGPHSVFRGCRAAHGCDAHRLAWLDCGLFAAEGSSRCWRRRHFDITSKPIRSL